MRTLAAIVIARAGAAPAAAEAGRTGRLLSAWLHVVGLVLRAPRGRAGYDPEAADRDLSVGLSGDGEASERESARHRSRQPLGERVPVEPRCDAIKVCNHLREKSGASAWRDASTRVYDDW